MNQISETPANAHSIDGWNLVAMMQHLSRLHWKNSVFLPHQSVLRLIPACVIGCFALISSCHSASAADWTKLSLGYQSVGKVGKWLPVHAAAANLPVAANVELRAEFSDPRGDTCRQTLATGAVSNDGTIALRGFVKCGRLAGTGTVSLVAESGEVLCRKSISHGEDLEPETPSPEVQSVLQLFKLDVPLLMTIGTVAGVDELLRNADLISENRPILKGISVPHLADMPDDVAGLDAVNILILSDEFATSDRQTKAIQQWVRTGGRLLVTTGASAPLLLESNLGQWLNGYFEISPTTTLIRNLTALQSFVPGASRLETNRRAVPMAVLQSTQSLVEVDTLNGPIISSQSIGAGVVSIVAIALNQRPVNSWNSLPQLYEVLFFGEKLSRKAGVSSRSSRISQSGISDLATQMMSVIDASPESGRWSTWSIMAMTVGWLLLIGPIDYYLVTFILKRPHLTWVTFPLLIIAGVAGTVWGLGTNSKIQLNELNIVDISNDGKSSHIDTKSWLSISSPQTMKAVLQANPTRIASADNACTLMWSGRPEDVYGGMYRTGGIGLSRQTYMHATKKPNTLTGMPLLTDGSRQMLVDWHSVSEKPLIEADLVVSGFGLLNGTFSHNLPFAFSDFVIMHGNRVYRMNGEEEGSTTLEPGEIWDSRSDLVSASDLKGFLNGSRLVKTSESQTNRGSTQQITPYNARSQDIQYMLTMATFYDVAGGVKYVGLSQDLLGHMELSDTIRLNHAVAIGIIDTPVTSLSMNDSEVQITKSNTFVRLLLPVKRRPSEKLAQTEEELRKAEEEAAKNSDDTTDKK